MPPPLDLAGRVFGRLTVLGRGERVKFGRWQQGWRCRCDCGAELTVPQDRLPHAAWIARMPGRVVDACPTCRGSACVICGAVLPLSGDGHGRRTACPGACEDARRKERQRESWHRRVATDPDLPRRMHARRLERAAADPEYATRLAAWERDRQARRQARIQADPEYAEQVRAWRRATYARHAKRIQAERRARLEALSPAERQAWCDRARRYCRNWRRRHMEALRADPAAYQRYRDVFNEYRRQWYALQAGPPPERACVVCGATFATHKLRVLCQRPECLAAYRRDVLARSRARAAAADFLRIERELSALLRTLEPPHE